MAAEPLQAQHPGVATTPHRPSDDDRWQVVPGCDGTPIAWIVEGTGGGVPVVLCNGIACSDAYWYGVTPELARSRQVIRWDYRGHGRSGNPNDRAAIDVQACAADLAAVLDAAGVGRAVLVGHSYGVGVALEGYRRMPERVAGIVAVAGAPVQQAGRSRGTETREGVLAALQGLMATSPEVARRTWDRVWDSPALYHIARLIGGTTVAAPPEVLQSYFTHVRDRDPQLLLDMLRAMHSHDPGDVLGRLEVPLLALAGDRDRFTPLVELRRMALQAPHAQLAIRHGAAHTLPAEHPGWVADEIDRFVATEVEDSGA